MLRIRDTYNLRRAGRSIEQLIAREMDIRDLSKLLYVDEAFLRELLKTYKYLSMGVRVYKPPKSLELCCLINGFFSVVDLESVNG